MSEAEFADAVITLINESRSSLNLDGLVELDTEKNNEGLFFQAVTVEKEVEGESQDQQANVDKLIAEIGDILNGENLTDELSKKRDLLLSSAATHTGVSFSVDGQVAAATIKVFFKYLEMEPIGPVIDGALVVQGTSCSPQFGPSLCKIEYAAGLEDRDEDYSEVLTVAPWEMIVTPASEETSGATFQIPINIGTGYKEGTCRVTVYVDDVSKVSYDEEKAEYIQDVSAMVSRALAFSTPVVGAPADDVEGDAAAEAGAAAVATAGESATGDEATAAAADGALGESLSAMKIEGESGGGGGDHIGDDGNRRQSRGGNASSIRVPVVTSIKVAQGYDEVSQYRAEGYDIHCVRFNETGGLDDDQEQEQMWKFHLMFKLGAYVEGGAVEDVIWVKSLKASGALPEVPEGYEILHESDLSGPDDENSVYLAYKLGSQAITRVTMYATTNGTSDQQLATDYTEATPHTIMHAAPEEIEKTHQGACGLFLYVAQKEEQELLLADEAAIDAATAGGQQQQEGDDVAYPEGSTAAAAGEVSFSGFDTSGGGDDFAAGVIAAAENAAAAAEEEEGGEGGGVEGGEATGRSTSRKRAGSTKKSGRSSSRGGNNEEGGDEDGVGDAGEEDDAFSRVTSDLGSDEDFLESRSEEEIIDSLEQRIIALEVEKLQLLAVNADLQKKAVSLLAREKLVQGQSQVHKMGAVASSSADAAATAAAGVGGGGGAGGTGTGGTGGESNVVDHAAEKERQFQESLQQIVESRVKLERQQTEFDQLALDLQTRLDDKEFKAGEIAESFHAFKKEILGKAENSRTGQPISKSLVRQFEQAEQKREEDLEKVRLRNISLRTSLRKMERTLRAREQLAEGLHMIDFEQLKIENQTLNEKIEERNEELAKLKKKKTVTVQVLTHLREKLQFVSKTNDRSRKELDYVETEILNIRSDLNSSKKDRDSIRDDNKELKRKQGFANNDLLLFDYEKRKALIDRAKDQVIDLQERYRVLSKQVMEYSHKASRGQMLLNAPTTSISAPFTSSGIRK